MSAIGQVLEAAARHLVDRPERVRVEESEHRGTALVELYMDPDDLGRVIGRQGRTAAALRTLATAVADRDGIRVQVEFRDAPASG